MEIKKLYQVNIRYEGLLRFTYHLAKEDLRTFPYDCIISGNEFGRSICTGINVNLLKVF